VRGHVGPDDNIQGDHTDIRPKEEVERWKKRDPIIRIETFLLENNFLNDQDRFQIRNEVESEIKDALSFARSSSFPRHEEVGENVFS
jgi:pyruvate dehydrogenase E1 component alpha subunit